MNPWILLGLLLFYTASCGISFYEGVQWKTDKVEVAKANQLKEAAKDIKEINKSYEDAKEKIDALDSKDLDGLVGPAVDTAISQLRKRSGK